MNLSGLDIEKRVILDGDVFELEAYGRDKEELKTEGERLANEGLSGFGFNRIREYAVGETNVEGVYGLWVR